MNTIHTIDDNSRQVGMGYAPDISDSVQPFLVDNHDEFSLLIEVIPVSPQGNIIFNDITEDENSIQIAAGLTNKTGNDQIQALSIDLIAGLPCLRVDLDII